MRTKVSPEIDKAIIDACSIVGFKYEVPPEVLKDTDAYLDEIIALIRPNCDWPREDIKLRIGTLRKNGKLYRVSDVRAAKRSLQNH